MTIHLQQTDHKQSRYERPNQKWVCGWASDGHACAVGPDGKGRCTAAMAGECTPWKDGDRWQCTRLEVFGGPCDPGPRPNGECGRPEMEHSVCQPRRSLRARRMRVVLVSVMLATGVLIAMLTGPWRMSFISPGGLSSAHMAIEPPPGASHNCAVCHVAADPGQNLLAASASGFRHDMAIEDSAKCLTCHFTGEGTGDALLIHGVGRERLAKSGDAGATEAGAPTLKLMLASLAGRSSQVTDDQLACATCHQEHRGRKHDLAMMDDTRCQVCHRAQFESFSRGHPEFWPVRRTRGGIGFDHLSHQQTHFGDAAFDCMRCHDHDAAGRTMLLKPFAQSCAGCHQQGRSDHHGDGIKKQSVVIFQWPEMEIEEDMEWLEDAAVGEQVTPMVRLLLAGDDAAVEALRSLHEAEWYAGEWEPDDEALRAVFTEAMKRLFVDMVNEDAAACRERLAAALGADEQAAEVSALADQLSAARFAVSTYQRQWLAGLDSDSDEMDAEAGESSSDADWSAPDDAAGWFVDPDDVAVVYKATAHSDAFFRAWIDALVGNARRVGPPSEESSASDDDSPDDASVFRSGLRRQVYEEVVAGKGASLSGCVRCHRLDDDAGAPRINWFAAGRETEATGYGKYSHRPHLEMLRDDRNCYHCHQPVDTAADEQSKLVSRGLQPHSIDQCTKCHTPGRAGETCLTCHNYHIQRP